MPKTNRKRREGWWKPFISGAVGGLVGGGAGFLTSGGNPVAAISGAVAGADKGFKTHENIRKDFNVPWLGKKKRRVKGKGKKRARKKKR